VFTLSTNTNNTHKRFKSLANFVHFYRFFVQALHPISQVTKGIALVVQKFEMEATWMETKSIL
jgi:hypothetical protein